MTQEALKLALEALITASGHVNNEAFVKVMMARDAVVEALAQEQEPVAWRSPKWSNLHGKYGYRDFDDPVTDINGKPSPYNEPLYIHPQRTWVGLTKKEVHDLYDADYVVFHQRIEAKLKEKNT